MAEQKKKPTPRKAPKGGLSARAGTDEKAQRKAVKEALAESEAQEKAAAKEAVEHAKEAAKERKAERKAAAKAERAAAKKAAKEARAEKKAQRKASKSKEKEPAAAPGGEVEEAGFSSGEAFDEDALSEDVAGLAPDEGFEETSEAGRVARTVRFVSGEDAYRAPAAGSRGASGKRADGGRRVRWGRVFGIVIGVLLAAVVVVAAVYSWNRWLRYDDAADFQGTWTYGEGGALSVTFDGSTMTLTKDAAYGYELDTFAKTVSYRFGELSGSGCYAFSEDRNTLVIVDGRSADAGSILGLVDIAQNAGVEDDGTSTVIVLSRAGATPTAPAAGETASSSQEVPAPSSSETTPVSGSNSGQMAPGESSSTESVDAETPDEGGADASTAGEDQTDQDIEALGEDPGSEAGANVVTPEDLGLSSSETEEQ